MTPGSTLWLLRHDLQLLWRRGKQSAINDTLRLLGWASLAQLVGLGAAAYLTSLPTGMAGEPVIATAALVFIALFTLATALPLAVETLFERPDLEWLLTSPLPFHRVLAARLIAVSLRAGLFWLLLLAGFANAMALFGRPAMLALYPVALSLSVMASCVAFAVVVLLVPRIGLRRTRAISAALRVLLGAAGGLMGQYNTLFSSEQREAVWQAVAPACCAAPTGLSWWPARAALGEFWPALTLSCLALALAWFTIHALHRSFVAGAGIGAERRPAESTTAAGLHRRFTGGTRLVLLRHELRLLRRTPSLRRYACGQLIYLVPIAVALWRGGSGILITAMLLPVYISGELAMLFAATASAGDEASELARCAPMPGARLYWGRLQAAAAAVLSIVAVPVLALAAWRPADAPLLLAGIASLMGVGLMVGSWSGLPARKCDLGAARLATRGLHLSGFVINLSLTATLWLGHSGNIWAFASAGVAAIAILLTWLGAPFRLAKHATA